MGAGTRAAVLGALALACGEVCFNTWDDVTMENCTGLSFAPSNWALSSNKCTKTLSDWHTTNLGEVPETLYGGMTQEQYWANKSAGEWSSYRITAEKTATEDFPGWKPLMVIQDSTSLMQKKIEDGLSNILAPILVKMTNVTEEMKSKVVDISKDVEDIGQSFTGIATQIRDLEEIGEYYVKLDNAMQNVTICKSKLTAVFRAIKLQQPDVPNKDEIIDECKAILTEDLRKDFNKTENCSKTERRLGGAVKVQKSFIPDLAGMTDDERRAFCFERHAETTDPKGIFGAVNCGPGATYDTCGDGLTEPSVMWPDFFRSDFREAIVTDCLKFWALATHLEVFDLYKNLLNDATKLTEMTDVLNSNVEYVKDATIACNKDLGEIKEAYQTNVERMWWVYQCQKLAAEKYTEIAQITSTTTATTITQTTSTEFVFDHLSACQRRWLPMAALLATSALFL